MIDYLIKLIVQSEAHDLEMMEPRIWIEAILTPKLMLTTTTEK